MKDEMIVMDSEYAIGHPDDIARILVNAGNHPPALRWNNRILKNIFCN